jgi:hypothetical protein
MWLDRSAEGLMRHLLGVPEEGLQVTHRWNNHHLHEKDVSHLYSDWMASHPGDPNARKMPKFPFAHALAHSTRYGGWQRYLVLDTVSSAEEEWYVGWRWQGGQGVSRIAIQGPRRVLIGPGSTEWFGISAFDNSQTPIRIIGGGIVGDGGEYSKLPIF